MFFSICVDVSLWCDELMLYNIYFDIKVDIWRQSPHPSSSGRLYFLEFSAGSGSSSATWKVITANVRTCTINEGWAFAFKYNRSFGFIPWVVHRWYVTDLVLVPGAELQVVRRGQPSVAAREHRVRGAQLGQNRSHCCGPNRWIIVKTINWSL